MSKKDFKSTLTPATMFINTQQEETQEVKETKPSASIKVNAPIKEETKSKRYNLLIYPSLFEDLGKIAKMDKSVNSVNDLINNALTSYRDKNQDKISKYNEVFGE